MDIINVKRYMKAWAKYSYGEGLEFCQGCSVREKEQLSRILRIQELYDRKMNGNSVEHIPYKYEGALNDVSMSKAFNDSIEKDYLTPAYYLLNLLRYCNLYNKPEGMTVGIIGRGLRSLPSFIREMDLAYKLQEQIEGAHCYRGGVDDDIQGHTDLFLEYRGEVFRIWSYQNTSVRAISNTISKICGNRGELPDGLFILCPFNMRDNRYSEEIEGWKLYSKEYSALVEDALFCKEVSDYQELLKENFNVMSAYVKNIRIFKK